MLNTDFLIIGAGIAGLSFAIKTAEKYPKKKVVVITKGEADNCNSRLAQGGIAAVFSNTDNQESHFQDTIIAGAKYNSREAVKVLVEEAPDRINDLINWGVSFDKEPNGHYKLALEGGHSMNRILHHKDSTGNEIMRVLLEKCLEKQNIIFQEKSFAIDLLIAGCKGKKECFGAVVFIAVNRTFEVITSKVTVLATGGAAQVYANTTNPSGACGDGIVLASQAGARVEGMEFIQFHPTGFYKKGETPSFLISEAVRGAGAVIVNKAGNDFVKDYDQRGSLAPRDIVSRAIYSELKVNMNDCVYLDCTKVPLEIFQTHFPNIYQKCRSEKIDVKKDYIPVAPSAHYTCGGIATDISGRTNINRLFALGECSFTGVHGGNRLASNSLSEALVFAHKATESLDNTLLEEICLPNDIDFDVRKEIKNQSFNLVKADVKKIMWDKAGVIKSTSELISAKTLLNDIRRYLSKQKSFSPELSEVLFLTDAAILIVEASLKRDRNIGTFYNQDLL